MYEKVLKIDGFEIDLDLSTINEQVMDAIQGSIDEMFGRDYYGDPRGDGARVIDATVKPQVLDYIRRFDASEIIAAAVEKRVVEVVREEVDKQLRRKINAMIKSGEVSLDIHSALATIKEA